MTAILQDFSAAALAAAIEANGIEGCKAWAAWGEMELVEEPDMIWSLTGVPFPLFNNVFAARLDPQKISERIKSVIVRAYDQGVPVAWWTAPSTRPTDLGTHLEKHGFQCAEPAPMMAIDLHKLQADSPLPGELEIEPVRDVDALQTFCEVMARVFDFPGFAIQPWFDMLASGGLEPGRSWQHWLGWQDEEAVATASRFTGAGVAGIASVGTMPEARRKGIATAMTLGPLHEAREEGYRIGTLFSSPMAAGLYRKLGFKEYSQGGCYIWSGE